jgi:beta-phosphoglucomutase-like phosphatase (HAD superfamily)
MAVVSSSRNAPDVLRVAGMIESFPTIVDGRVAGDRHLAGKPAPDTFLYAAQQLGVEPSRAVVLEDALSGVAAGRAGHFGLVIGVDRGVGVEALTEHGADRVVTDLAELL